MRGLDGGDGGERAQRGCPGTSTRIPRLVSGGRDRQIEVRAAEQHVAIRDARRLVVLEHGDRAGDRVNRCACGRVLQREATILERDRKASRKPVVLPEREALEQRNPFLVRRQRRRAPRRLGVPGSQVCPVQHTRGEVVGVSRNVERRERAPQRGGLFKALFRLSEGGRVPGFHEGDAPLHQDGRAAVDVAGLLWGHSFRLQPITGHGIESRPIVLGLLTRSARDRKLLKFSGRAPARQGFSRAIPRATRRTAFP